MTQVLSAPSTAGSESGRSAAGEEGEAGSRRPLAVSYCAFVAGLVGLLLFLPALANGFAYDDVAVVAGDARVHSLSNLGLIFSLGYWADAGLALYRPLTTLSFALDWSLGSGSSAWFHFSNALGHAIACALVVLLLARFFSPAAALVGGLVFAVHPVHVEAVANVVGRAEVFAGALMLGACVLWTSHSELPAWRAVRNAGVALLYALALLTKESAVMLPALLVLLDSAHGSLRLRNAADYVRRNAVALSLFAVTLAGFMALRVAVLGSWAPARLDPTLEVATAPLQRFLTALQAWPHYFRLLFFPRTLLADYGPRVINPADGLNGAVVAGALVLGGCVAGGLYALVRGHGRSALALLWAPVAMLPVSNLLVAIGVLVAERTLYLPSFALSVAIAGATTALIRQGRATRVVQLAAAGVIALLALRTLERVPEWESTDRIMIAQVRDRPDSFRGHWHLARLARLGNDTTAALERYASAISLWSQRKALVMEAAGFAAGTGRLQFAHRLAAAAAKSWPEDIDAQRLLAGTAMDLGDTATALGAVRAGLRLDPRDDVLRRMREALPPETGARE